ncbi:MAG: PAS domain-containing protein [Alphaproteobacteria bacterium]|nr:PAS domain-containing protein [Alphaproteobacteria bacterium]
MELPDAAAAHPRMVAVWDALLQLGGGMMPDRRGVDPVELPLEALPWLFLIDVWPDRAVFRLAGTEIVASTGRELKGVPLDGLVSGTAFDDAWVQIRQTIDDNRAVYADRRVESTNGRTLSFHRLLIPLKPLNPEFRTIIGVTVSTKPAT